MSEWLITTLSLIRSLFLYLYWLQIEVGFKDRLPNFICPCLEIIEVLVQACLEDIGGFRKLDFGT